MSQQNNQYINKIEEFFLNDLKKIKKPKIIEFGVRFGFSTKKIIEICEKNNGFLHAIDIDDCSDVSDSKFWKFYKSRDDNFEYLDKFLPKDVDLILPDVSIEVGMFMANLSAFALEKDLHTSVLICFPRKFSRWSDMPWVRHPVILLGSIGKVKEFRRDSMNNKEKRKDRKPGPEIVLKWI